MHYVYQARMGVWYHKKVWLYDYSCWRLKIDLVNTKTLISYLILNEIHHYECSNSEIEK